MPVLSVNSKLAVPVLVISLYHFIFAQKTFLLQQLSTGPTLQNLIIKRMRRAILLRPHHGMTLKQNIFETVLAETKRRVLFLLNKLL